MTWGLCRITPWGIAAENITLFSVGLRCFGTCKKGNKRTRCSMNISPITLVPTKLRVQAAPPGLHGARHFPSLH